MSKFNHAFCDRSCVKSHLKNKLGDRMIKQLLGEIEQNIVICQWRGDQLIAEAPASPLACFRCSENETLLQLAALKVGSHKQNSPRM